MAKTAPEAIIATDAGANILSKNTKNMKPCAACSKARKKCELVAGAYPCKRCIDRFFGGISKDITCAPSQKCSGLRNGGVSSAPNGGQASMEDHLQLPTMLWIPYYGPQGMFANDIVAPAVPPPHITSSIDEAQHHALNDHDVPPFIADSEAFGQAFEDGSSDEEFL